MKLGFTLSSAAHVVILTWGLVSLTSPEALKVQDVEALPVDIVPIEEITKTVKGAEEAEIAEKSAPTPTKRETPKPEAQNVGDKEIDSKPVENAERESPVPVEKAEAPPKAEAPAPKPEPKPEPVKEEAKTPVETTEVAAAPQPKADITPETPADSPEQPLEGEQFAKLPDTVPVPSVKPTPPKPTVAKTNERKKVEELIRESGGQTNGTEKQEDVAVKNKVNKAESAGGGAKTSTQTAALGARRGNAEKLSQSEMDALIAAITQCSTGIAGRRISEDLRIKVIMRLDRNGNVIDAKAGPTGGTAEERARFPRDILRYVKRCAPYDFLPKDKYETWAEVVPTFYPAQMFQ
ncbi:MAG: hypothetical protein JJ891_16545 [Rhizobiaceae bacterium]|jgi:outer membrane biosynthesis protein TonB|nr:hypothetical protein [Rhizobiaceae bacterium]